MGDFIQFNPGLANALSDVDYANSTYRQNGAVTGVAPANVHNKLYYQVSTFVAAFAQMMKAKGFTMSDADISALRAELANVVTMDEMEAYAAMLAGSSSQVFQAANGTTGKQVVNISQFGASITNNGWQRLPTGFIIQWGYAAVLGQTGHLDITFPIAFPNYCSSVLATNRSSSVVTTDIVGADVPSVTGVRLWFSTDADTAAECKANWLAIGR